MAGVGNGENGEEELDRKIKEHEKKIKENNEEIARMCENDLEEEDFEEGVKVKIHSKVYSPSDE